MSYFLFDAIARFIVALLLIPLIIYVYTKLQNYPGSYSVLHQLVHFVYVFFLVFLTDDLFFKFMYLRDEFKNYLHNDRDIFLEY